MNWARIAGFIFLAYIVFTTMKGNLRKWLQIIGLKPDDNMSTGAVGGMGVTSSLPTVLFDLPDIGLRGRSN